MKRLAIPQFDRARVLVIGDVMLDRYWSGDVARISPEAPVPVVEIARNEERAGGAANVAVNLAALGATVGLVGLVGRDANADILARLLSGSGVQCNLVVSEDEPTIVKLRVLSRNQQLIRLDMEKPFTRDHAGAIAAAARQDLAQADVLILSDYGKNTLSDLAGLIALADGRPVLVDPKGTDFSRYFGVTVLKPNRAEFEAVVGKCADENELVTRGKALVRELSLGYLLLTLGPGGMLLISSDGNVESFPAQAREVYDVTGAGDTVISTLAAAISSGLDMVSATALANLAAGIVVRKLGTASVSAAELAREASQAPASRFGVLSETELLGEIAAARNDGARIVFTNGCFDILHAGHARYLEQAKGLGDRLVVAVNTDESVRRLKGPERPHHDLAARMELLAALRPVDWVVPFGEDTPERLLRLVRPDVLVKGGDYSPEKIVGSSFVQAYGGEVRVLDYVEGYSTTAALASLRRQP